MESQNPQTSQKQPPIDFDQELVSRFEKLAAEALGDHVELRGVVVIFDYRGGLNLVSNVKKGLWLCEDGPATRPDEIFGGLEVTQAMLEMQVNRAGQLMTQMRDEAQVVGQELARRRAEHGDS